MSNSTLCLELIEKTFAEKKLKNPSYSYRALSRDLGISQSLLSKVVTGKRKVTPEFALRVALGLKLPESDLIGLVVGSLPNRTSCIQ